MSNEKTTIYLDPKVKKNVQYYAIQNNSSLSEIINKKLVEYLEDMMDIAELKKRDKDEEFIPLEEVLAELGIDEKDLQNKV